MGKGRKGRLLGSRQFVGTSSLLAAVLTGRWRWEQACLVCCCAKGRLDLVREGAWCGWGICMPPMHGAKEGAAAGPCVLG